MADPRTIRLTDFTQGIQTTDRLDYASNAVRAGSNVTLAETIQTRGGLSTVDSVGLPADSEIMSLAQVKFPTNEKTYLVAQVKYPYITADYEVDLSVGCLYTADRIALFGKGGSEGSYAGWSFDNISLLADTTTLLSLPFTSLNSGTYFGTGFEVDASGDPYTAVPPYGIVDGEYCHFSYFPVITFPDADTTAISAALLAADTVKFTFTMTKQWDSGENGETTNIFQYVDTDVNIKVSYGYGSDITEPDETLYFCFNGNGGQIDVPFLAHRTPKTFVIAFNEGTVYVADTGDISTGYSYALYAMPDTLPDTGA